MLATENRFRQYAALVEEPDDFLAACARPLPVCVWTNPLRAAPARVAEGFAADGRAAVPLGWYPGGFRLADGAGLASRASYLLGHYHIQEEASLLPALLLAPRPGERVLDLCAAPGGKTAQLAVMMENRGTLVANDRSGGRLNVVHTTVDRLGLLNVVVTCEDAALYPSAAGLYDAVLADVPCSCEGTIRKHPRVLEKTTQRRREQLVRIQTRILRRAVALCRPGGRVVYATCTFAPEENEAVVAEVLATCPGLRVRPFEVPGLRTTPGLTGWDGATFPATLRHTRRLWPHHNDTGGFFVALLDVPTGEVPA